jgi:hypothetical protein
VTQHGSKPISSISGGIAAYWFSGLVKLRPAGDIGGLDGDGELQVVAFPIATRLVASERRDARHDRAGREESGMIGVAFAGAIRLGGQPSFSAAAIASAVASSNGVATGPPVLT